VQVLPVGVHFARIDCTGNALLTTLWVKSAGGGSVLVEYWDWGPGSNTLPGERVPLGGHPLISTDDTSDKRILTKVHNKLYAQITVTGGPVELGIYTTVVESSALPTPHLDGGAANVLFDGGFPLVTYDEAGGKFYLLRTINGALSVTFDTGIPKTLAIAGTFTDNSVQDLLTGTVPAGKKWQILSASLSTRAYTNFKLYSNAVLQGGGFTGAAESNVRIALDEKPEAVAGQEVKIAGQKTGGPNNDFIATIRLREISV